MGSKLAGSAGLLANCGAMFPGITGLAPRERSAYRAPGMAMGWIGGRWSGSLDEGMCGNMVLVGGSSWCMVSNGLEAGCRDSLVIIFNSNGLPLKGTPPMLVVGGGKDDPKLEPLENWTPLRVPLIPTLVERGFEKTSMELRFEPE